MGEISGKAELLRRLAAEQARLQAVLAAIPSERAMMPGVMGEWSVKDILAHLIAHEQRALAELEAARIGRRLAIDHAANDSFNEGAMLASRPHVYVAMRAAWEASYQRIVATVETLTDADFAPGSALTRALDDTLDGALGNNTYGHWAEHFAIIEEWRLAAGDWPSH